MTTKIKIQTLLVAMAGIKRVRKSESIPLSTMAQLVVIEGSIHAVIEGMKHE